MARSFDPEVLLTRPLLANLATVCVEGSRNAPVWYLWEDAALWMLGSEDNSSVRRLQDDPRCAVEITDFDTDRGILLHLGMRGRAEVTEMDPDLFRRVLAKYLGADESAWNPWFIETIARVDDPGGRLIKLVPESIFTNNVSYFKTGPDLAWPAP